MEELIKKAINGDEESYITLIKSIQGDLFRIARIRLDNIEDVNDAIQETMIISFKELKKLKHFEFFKTWIIRILINQCNLIYKKKNKQVNLFNKLLHNNYSINDDYSIQDKESEIDFENMLSILNYDEKMAVTLYYDNKFSLKEISKILGTSVNTIKSRLRRAKDKIKIYNERRLEQDERKQRL